MRRPPNTPRTWPPVSGRWARAGARAVLLATLALFWALPASAQITDLRAEHDRRARELVNRGQLEEAAAEWREFLKLAPDNIPIRRNLGVVLLRLGRVEEAEEVLLEAVSLDPNQAATHLHLGRTYLRQGKTRLAESELLTAQSLDPTNPNIDISLAVLEIRKGNYASAETHLQRALTFNYKDPDIHAALGDVYRAKGRWDQAEKAYRTALKLDAFHLGAKRGLQKTEGERRLKAASPEERSILNALRVENPTTRIEGGRFVVEGLVANISKRATTKYVTVTCQLYGRHQRIIAEKEALAEPEILGPGQRGRWKLSVPYNPEFSGQMELGVKAIVEDPEAKEAGREALKRPSVGRPKEQATFFGGNQATREDVLKVSIPKLGTQDGRTVLHGYVLNVGVHPVASIDLNFRIVERTTGRLHTQQFAQLERQALEPGERADYTLEWKEGVDPNSFRLQMKVGWAELFDPAAATPVPQAPSPRAVPEEKLPHPMPEPLPSRPRN
jgi:Flp pilus assembly protein TadD